MTGPAASKAEARLPVSFHATFTPDRAYIREVLAYAAAERSGTKEAIRDETGIPTGAYSGKVEPTLRYAQGMGLLEPLRPTGGVYAPRLTALGRAVHEQDPGLDTGLTQLMGHLHLCRRVGGAEAWYQVFTAGFPVLGLSFDARALDALVVHSLGEGKLGPLPGTCAESSALAKAAVLSREGERWTRHPAPLATSLAAAYAVMTLALWERHFPGERQVTGSQFEAETQLFAMAGWDAAKGAGALDLMAEVGAIAVGRQVQDPVLTRLAVEADFLSALYDALP